MGSIFWKVVRLSQQRAGGIPERRSGRRCDSSGSLDPACYHCRIESMPFCAWRTTVVNKVDPILGKLYAHIRKWSAFTTCQLWHRVKDAEAAAITDLACSTAAKKNRNGIRGRIRLTTGRLQPCRACRSLPGSQTLPPKTNHPWDPTGGSIPTSPRLP